MSDAVRNSKDPKETVEIMKEYEKVLKAGTEISSALSGSKENY